MPTIKKISALEILDSRGRPPLAATCELESGARASASVPSGASTGAGEAMELRDGDMSRYEGLGCRKAVAHINEEIQRCLGGRSFTTQSELDKSLVTLDGSPNKSQMGANAILGVSLAFARASAVEEKRPLYQYFAVGWQADYIKIGPITQPERLAKYNRLLEIEHGLREQTMLIPSAR